MKNLILWCAFLSFFMINAQNSTGPSLPNVGVVSGKVIDKNLQQPIPYATVAIKAKTDQSTITGAITDEDGTFELKGIPDGSLVLEVSFIGYKTHNQEITIGRGGRRLNVGTITLEENVDELEGVDVVAERSTIEQRIDRKVINVGKDLQTAGPTASDIMNNLPSVSVDQQTGALSLRGNQNVRVMVDGKLTNVPVAQLLKQIPSTSIKKIELITNPSAKYNPEGMSGIINIVLIKNAMIGFNGNINIGLNYDDNARFNSGIDLNYRNNKLNLFGNYSNNISKNFNRGNVFRSDDNSDQQFAFLDDSKTHLFKVGFDFYLNEKNTISVFTNQNFFDGGTLGTTDIVNMDAADDFSQIFNNIRDNLSSQYNFNYKLDFAKDDHNIELEADYNTFENDEDATFDFRGNTTTLDYEDFVDTERDRLTVNLDYVNPIDEKTKLELGLEARLFNSDIARTSSQFVQNPFDLSGGDIPGPSTDFDYSRDIYSAYATYGKKWEKWSVQVGARFETVSVTADTEELYEPGITTDDLSNITTDDNVIVTRDGDKILRKFENDYTQIYPSAFVTYTASEKNSYQMSYSRRVDRPGLQQVNPIREWSTPLITSFGRSSLVPQFTNSLELNYTRRLKSGSVTAGVFYRAIEDEINRAVFVDRLDPELNRIILTFDNFNNTSAYGFELSSNYRPTKWWSINGSFDFFSQKQRGLTEFSIDEDGNGVKELDEIFTEERQVTNTAWNFRMFNNFSVTKKLTLSAFGFYRGKNRNIQFDVDPMVFVNLGARYNFAEGKGTFSLNYNDIFNTMEFRFNGDRPYPQEGRFNWESQTVFAGLSYRFGGGKYRAKQRRSRDNNEKQGSGGIF
ncbi:outer membrane beta-barrel protein [Sungkyunkwania multivorans]|uniref:Outer membrane beta-barrel protein n=1 Tax=Sungkyunkwania multivorans TaxID=1173618 RepID=A0ABW3CWG6_9FLAO